MIAAVNEMGPTLGYASTCAALGLARATFYRRTRRLADGPRPARAKPKQTLGAEERQAVLAVLHEDRFVDRSRRGLRPVARRRPAPLLHPHDVPSPGRKR